MRVDRAGEVLGAAAVVHEEHRFGDQFGGVAGDDVRAEHAVRLGAGDDFREALGRVGRNGAAVGGEGEFAHAQVDFFLLRLLFRKAEAGRLGRGVDPGGNDVVVPVARLAREPFRDRDALLVRLVGQHRTIDDIADGIDARHAGLPVAADGDAALVGEFDARLFEIEPRGERLAAHGYEDDFRRVGNFRVPLGAFQFDALVGDFRRGDLGAELKFHAELFQVALEDLRRLGVEPDRRNAGQKFDHGDLRAEPRPDRAELQPDRARADDEHRFRHFVERDALVAADDPLAVVFQEREFDRHAAGGEQDALRLERFFRAALVRDFDGMAVDQPAEALHDFDLVFLHQVGDARSELAHDLALALHHRAEIEPDVAGDDAVRGEPLLREMEMFARRQQRLARDAPDVEAGAAERFVLLHDGGFEAELRGADRGDVTAGAASDDDEL